MISVINLINNYMRDNYFYNLYINLLKESQYQDTAPAEAYLTQYNDILSEIIYSVKKLRKGSKKKIPFTPFPAGPLIKMWKDYGIYYQVRNTKLLDELIDSMIRKVIIIRIGTEMGGHTRSDPIDILSDSSDETFTEEFANRVSNYLEDSTGTWLISDYGLDKMEAIAIQLLKMGLKPEEKLLLADQMLNVVHQRSDLAGWFVEGGRKTLENLSND